jgi:hypothetical protein
VELIVIKSFKALYRDFLQIRIHVSRSRKAPLYTYSYAVLRKYGNLKVSRSFINHRLYPKILQVI